MYLTSLKQRSKFLLWSMLILLFISLKNMLSNSEQKHVHSCKTKLLNSKTISKGVSKRHNYPLDNYPLPQARWLICHLGELKSNLMPQPQVRETTGKVTD